MLGVRAKPKDWGLGNAVMRYSICGLSAKGSTLGSTA